MGKDRCAITKQEHFHSYDKVMLAIPDIHNTIITHSMLSFVQNG